ncbi:MAG: FAD-binding oxidoreductase [Deltaproteobacteria bacterium]|nr:FAD-binding oxidoreductase [Deltaproteobacteria bacterium]
MKIRHDVLVIGGGLIGTAAAFFLAKEGVDVGLIERKGLASGTSGATMSNLSLHNRMPGPEWDLAMETWQIYKDLKENLGMDCEFEILSSLMLIEKEEDLAWARKRVADQRRAGLDIELITNEDVVKMDPYIGAKIAGAAFCKPTAWVNSMLLCKAFAMAARQLGAGIYTHTQVTDICVSNGKITGIKTPLVMFECENIINAAGPAADEIGKMVGCRIPIRKNRGTVVVTEPLPQIGIRNKAEGIDHAKFERDKSERLGENRNRRNHRDLEYTYDVHFTCIQTRRGHFLIGRSGEDHENQRNIQPDAITAILQRAVRFVPFFAKVKVQRVYAGIRPYSPDFLPMLGPVRHPQGFFLAYGFGDKGIGLGAAGVKHVVRSVLEKDYRIPRALHSDRFVSESEGK